MSEPSVLDYLLSLIDPRREKIDLEDREELSSEMSIDENDQETVLVESESSKESAKTAGIMTNEVIDVVKKEEVAEIGFEREPIYTPFRWRIALVVLFSLIGQAFLEPAFRNLMMGLIFYGLAAGFPGFIYHFRRLEIFRNSGNC